MMGVLCLCSSTGVFQLSTARTTMWMPTAGTRAQGIYKLRALRRETLFWINLLYRSSTPLSRSSILHSNARNCSSSHRTLLFCNVLETRDHLGISICFNKMQDVDSRSEMTDVCLDLASCVLSSLENQQELLDSHLQLHQGLLHGVAEVEHDEGPP